MPIRSSPTNEWNDGHDHMWIEKQGDWDAPEGFSEVICSKCHVPGQRMDETGEVFWPAT